MAPILACNVYISAGSALSHAPILLRLLQSSQDVARQSASAVVHAFCDPVYNRSSLHFTGSATGIAQLAIHSAKSAFDLLDGQASEESSPHPTVGLVDHISILPLADDTAVVAGKTAKQVGQALQDTVRVCYYGAAHPEHKSLARVRREDTAFFTTLDPRRSTCTVGAPDSFVENYNIRVRTDRTTARSMTKVVREREGGLASVEALTLPYDDGYEIACNLLRPASDATVKDIEAVARQWEASLPKPVIEKAYRVGTTASQCIEVFAQVARDDEQRRLHDTRVTDAFCQSLPSS